MIYDKIKEICKEKGVCVGAVEKQAGLAMGLLANGTSQDPHLIIYKL